VRRPPAAHGEVESVG